MNGPLRKIGRIAQISSRNAGLLVLDAAADADNFRNGMEIAAAPFVDAAPAPRCGAALIASVDRPAGTVTIERPGDIVGLQAGDFLFTREPQAAPAVDPAQLSCVGRWRIYFNRHGAAGLPWCVAPDAGGWEIAVAEVRIDGAARTVYQAKATPDDEDERPSGWVAVEGALTVLSCGAATITGRP